MREYKLDCCDFAAFVGLLNRMLADGQIYGYSYDSERNSVRVYFFQEAVLV